MSEWISVKDELPEEDCVCWVKNEKGLMFEQLALYDTDRKVFIRCDTPCSVTLTLDVTHYQTLP